VISGAGTRAFARAASTARRVRRQQALEVADHLARLVRAAVDGQPEREVRLPAVAVQERRVRRLKDDERLRSLEPRELLEAADEVDRPRQREQVAVRGQPPVVVAVRLLEGKLDPAVALERLLPVPEHRRGLRAAAPLTLLRGVVGVRAGDVPRDPGGAGGAETVAAGELVAEEPHRGAVEDELVRRPDEDVPPRLDGEERRPDRRLALHVEERPRLLAQAARERLAPGLPVELRQVDRAQRERARLGDEDARTPFRVGQEAGAQDGVPADDVGERGLERRPVEGAVEVPGDADVVRRRGMLLRDLEEPEVLLLDAERRVASALEDAGRARLRRFRELGHETRRRPVTPPPPPSSAGG
jgi:hypothetical protein